MCQICIDNKFIQFHIEQKECSTVYATRWIEGHLKDGGEALVIKEFFVEEYNSSEYNTEVDRIYIYLFKNKYSSLYKKYLTYTLLK
jgi:hypothetical protein